MKISSEEKQALVLQYEQGEPVRSICARTGIARSTFYTWIRSFGTVIKNGDKTIRVTLREMNNLKRKVKMLEERLRILQKVNCGVSAPLQERLREMEKLYGQYSVHALCDALCVARGTFYNHIFRRKEVTAYDKRKEEVKEVVRQVFDESHQRFGATKIASVLKERGICASYKYVAGLMREMGLKSVSTFSKKQYQWLESIKETKNILQRKFRVDEPNRIWVSDVTCFKAHGRYVYVCVILDLFSRKVVAHRVSAQNTTYLITSTFKLAFKSRNSPQNLMFHSDQGAQYTSKTFRELLRLNKVVQSFSRPGTPRDNAVAEAFFATMKREEIYRTSYVSERQFKESVDDYIEFYNSKRPHITLNLKTPNQFEEHYQQRQRSKH